MISLKSDFDLVEQARLLSAKLYRLYELEVMYCPVTDRTRKLRLVYKHAHARFRRRQMFVIKKLII